MVRPEMSAVTPLAMCNTREACVASMVNWVAQADDGGRAGRLGKLQFTAAERDRLAGQARRKRDPVAARAAIGDSNRLTEGQVAYVPVSIVFIDHGVDEQRRRVDDDRHGMPRRCHRPGPLAVDGVVAAVRIDVVQVERLVVTEGQGIRSRPITVVDRRRPRVRAGSPNEPVRRNVLPASRGVRTRVHHQHVVDGDRHGVTPPAPSSSLTVAVKSYAPSLAYTCEPTK